MVDQPDFENMSPEEIMAWMETLAKRQGATEGFTTDADLDIPEIDPDTVVIDEPGYVPYSESRSGNRMDDMPTVTLPTPKPAEPPTVAPPPIMSPPPRLATTPLTTPPPLAPRPATPPVMSPPPVPAPSHPAAPPPAARPPTPAWSAPAPKLAPEPEPQGSLAWLESLAQQNEDSLFNLDLSGLGEDTPESAPSDPSAWLEAMAATPDLQAIAGDMTETDDDTDSLRWLESLARRQGAPADELTTSADADVSTVRGEPEAPAYTPFSFNTAPTPRSTPKAADPADFLGSLAASEGYSEAGVLATREPEPEPSVAEDSEIEEIKRAISEGRVTPDQMQTFFERQVDFAETLPPGPDELEEAEDDALPVPADLPDWLLEQVQIDEPPPPPTPPPGAPPLESLFAASATPDIPDWLREDSIDAGADDLQGIFASVESDELAVPVIEVDTTDPWVEALDLEHTEGMAPVDAPPEWYLQNLSDPARVAAVEGSAVTLNDEPLPPESTLPLGEAQAVPDWVTLPAASETLVAEAEPEEDIPEWLREMENVVASSEIPAWLNEPVEPSVSDSLPFELEEAPPTPEFVVDTPTAPAPEPKPVAEVVSEAATPALESARQRRQSGDIAGSLAEYEALIRSNTALQDCVDDLAHVARLERDNPVVFRVLGDGYMRLGKLQLALDTYREALNHL